MRDNYSTRDTLLMRAVNQDDHGAWNEFVNYYQSFIFMLLLRLGVPRQECDDISQQVLLKLWKNLAKFDHSRGGFRTWLISVIRNTAFSHLTRLTRLNSRFELTEEFSRVMSEDGSDELESLFDKEWELYITNRAMENIKPLFSGKAVEVFTLSLNGTSVADIAAKLQIKEQSVYNLRNRVKVRLVDEIKHLRSELEL